MLGREQRAGANGALVAQKREPEHGNRVGTELRACGAERDAQSARSAGEQQGLTRRMGNLSGGMSAWAAPLRQGALKRTRTGR